MVRSDTVSSRLEWCFLRASYFASRGVMKRAVPRDFASCSVPVLSAQKPWFSQGFLHFGEVSSFGRLVRPCNSVHGGMRRCISRRAAQIESSFESHETKKARKSGKSAHFRAPSPQHLETHPSTNNFFAPAALAKSSSVT